MIELNNVVVEIVEPRPGGWNVVHIKKCDNVRVFTEEDISSEQAAVVGGTGEEN